MRKHPLYRHLPKKHFLKENVLKELNKLKKFYEIGNTYCLLDAYLFFERHSEEYPDIKMPQWIRDGIVKVLEERVADGRKIKKGTSGNEKSLARNRAKHFARWNCVNSFLERGMTLTMAYKKTEIYFLGTPIPSSESATGKSYRIVEKEIKDPEKRHKYLFPNRFNIERLGMKKDSESQYVEKKTLKK